MFGNDIPEMTFQEQWEMRKWLAASHEDGKCHIYGDDGELQCNNMIRHGRCLDFRRENISDLMVNIEATRILESGILQGDTKNIMPTDLVEMWKK